MLLQVIISYFRIKFVINLLPLTGYVYDFTENQSMTQSVFKFTFESRNIKLQLSP